MDDEYELPAEGNPFGRRHLLKQLAIAVALAAVLVGAILLVFAIGESMVMAPYTPAQEDAPK